VITADPKLELSFLQLALDLPEALDAGLTPEHMSTAINRSTHAAMLAVRLRGEPLDPVTVGHELEQRGISRASVAEHMAAIRSAPMASTASLVPVLRKLHDMRTLHEQATLGAALAVEAKVDEARDVLARAAFGATSPIEVFSIRDAMEAAAVEWHAAAQARQGLGEGRYLRLGLCPTLDDVMTVGPGDTVIVAAETNVGKSSISWSCIASLEARGIAAGLVSVEDPKADWGAKAIGYYGDLDTSPFWAGMASTEDYSRAERAVVTVAARKQLARMVVAKSGSLDEVCQSMAVLVRVHGARALFVDYIQAITHPMKGATRKQEVDTVYRRIQATARLLDVPLVLTSQMSRGDDSKAEPTVKRLKESGDLENGAQAILLCWVDQAEADAGWASAPVRVKIGKLKRAPRRPRVMLMRGPGGVLTEVPWQDPRKPSMGSSWTG